MIARSLLPIVFLCACGGDRAIAPDGPSGPTGSPGIRTIIGANQSDTARAQLAQALVVEVRGTGGTLAPDNIVRFTNAGGLSLCRLDALSCSGATAVDTTDAKGQAKSLIRLGTASGTARVAISVPILNLADTVSFTVLPGAPVRLSASVRDTTLYVGATYSVVATLRDANGNAITSSPTYTIVGSSIVSDGGSTYRSVATGRAAIAARSGTLVDTSWISVPPKGTIAVYDQAASSGIAKVELDGSGYRMVALTADTYYGINPTWTTSGSIVFETGDLFNPRLYVSDTLGNKQRVTVATTTLRNESFSAPARDGSIYFSAEGNPIDYGTGLFRVTALGAAPVRVGPNPPGNANAWKASASPDGKQLVYSDVNRGGLTILDVSTGAIRVVVPQADMPRWSPLGDWIAFSADSTLYRIRPDGTGRVRVGPNRFFAPRTDWSPDGQWLIAKGSKTLEVINVTTGESLPLAWGTRFLRPAWKP